MTIKEIARVSNAVHARICVPGSKSITNRALVCAALANGESIVHNASDSTDTAMMANGLNQLGVLVRKHDAELIVEGTGGRLFAPKFPIPVGNAGTTLRFMLGLGALAAGKTIFEGSDRMAERPMADLFDALGQLGTRASQHGIIPRFTVEGGSFAGGTVNMKAEKSSQFLSSVMMIAPMAERDVTINVDGDYSSRSYVEMTMRVMKDFGIVVQQSASSFRVESRKKYRPTEYHVEPDASGASYFLAAAALLGGEIFIEGMQLNSLQGDSRFVSILQRMGCRVHEAADGLRLRSDGSLAGVDVDMNSMPDVVPTLAALGPFAKSPTRIRNVAHLRHKESDRLEALHAELQRAGAQITILDDGLEIQPSMIHAAQLDTYDDHRLAMSFALLGLKTEGIRVENPDCVKKSFPQFWNELEKLYRSSSLTP